MKEATKSASHHIRAELKADRTQTAKDILAKLAAKGINVTAQSVYAVRSQLRKQRSDAAKKIHKTRRSNGVSLTDCIITVLYDHPDGLDARDLAKEVKKVYKTHATDFVSTLRNRLYALVGEGRLVKHNPSKRYTLSANERSQRATKKSSSKTAAASKVLTGISLDQQLLYDVKKLVGDFGDAVDEMLALEEKAAASGIPLVQYIETVKKLAE